LNVASEAITFPNIQETTTSFLFQNETPKTIYKGIKNDEANCYKNGSDLVDYRNRCKGVEAVAAKGGTTVIGETMDRVVDAAAKIPGSKILNTMPKFTGTADQITSQMMQNNRKWILNEMRSGRTILDIVLDAGRTNRSIFYEME